MLHAVLPTNTQSAFKISPDYSWTPFTVKTIDCMHQTWTRKGAHHPAVYYPYIRCLPSLSRVPVAAVSTRMPASADRTARCQFQATGQPVSWTQASDAMTSRLPRYEAKCVQRGYCQWGSVPLRSDIKGTELPSANVLIPLERQLIDLQLYRWQFYIMKFCSRIFVLYCRNCPKDDRFR